MKTGYSIKTWKMRLFCPEKQMIETTEALYREAVAFYYELLKESEELWAENLLTIQGHLEKLTVPGRDGREPKSVSYTHLQLDYRNWNRTDPKKRAAADVAFL